MLITVKLIWPGNPRPSSAQQKLKSSFAEEIIGRASFVRRLPSLPEACELSRTALPIITADPSLQGSFSRIEVALPLHSKRVLISDNKKLGGAISWHEAIFIPLSCHEAWLPASQEGRYAQGCSLACFEEKFI